MISVKNKLISAMVVKCGFNPESLIRKVEEGEEEKIKHELYGIYISRQKDIVNVGVQNPYFSKELVWYQWRV